MSSNEARLQKLKVAELKELLAKHHLVQTGKKDDLVKRLLDNGIEVDDAGQEVANGDAAAVPATESAESAAPGAAPAATDASAGPSQATDSATATATAPAPADALTPEQQAMKARAERFGIPFNPNPSPRAKPAPTPATASSSTPAAAAAAAPKEKEKAGPIAGSASSLGISEDVLAKRAAKFGLDKERAKVTAAAVQPTAAPAAPKEEELTPEMKEKLAIEEEKKRKRAEKFGTGKPVQSNGTTEPDAKKTKA